MIPAGPNPKPAWTVLHIAPCVGDPPGSVPFAYTEGVYGGFGKPNLWMSYRGACGHVLGTAVAHGCVNDIADRLITGEMGPGKTCDLLTGARDVLRFAAGDPIEGEEADAIEAWPADGGPILPLSWRCSLDDDWIAHLPERRLATWSDGAGSSSA